jgi:glutaredoxin-like protein NrdH
MDTKHVDGDNKGRVMLYALSTCVWCKKTKALLQELKVDFDYVDVDRLNAEEKSRAVEEIKKWNPPCSFPSLVVDDNYCIVGYDEAKIRERFRS